MNFYFIWNINHTINKLGLRTWISVNKEVRKLEGLLCIAKIQHQVINLIFMFIINKKITSILTTLFESEIVNHITNYKKKITQIVLNLLFQNEVENNTNNRINDDKQHDYNKQTKIMINEYEEYNNKQQNMIKQIK
ncbi:hypothetical protein EDI_006510 [Entamoeba dispar SAW760]|uniref:Uncharacterized protein n=1 Tax=Entamoeba dispar (strain ATCC PRA-260 / SAW760) TaxID=370354 RepID=B0EPN3_ENTDS|nr:uncharacterized protein EDI_006510 [Entamoeba dispar SAW760]EDR23510.1 hypothetical protein EDI_006510 [Entamoeba dispar SAW760]|eukprot:EDR23510.1 hypothetical protein EDI_006510 [Entamoeba dispar SAW760]